MKSAYVTLVTALMLCITTIAHGQRTLERAEVLEILEKLTSQRPTTWVPAGTIEARHQEYRAAKTTNVAEIEAVVQQEVQEYQDQTGRILRTAELQKQYLDALPFNVRYELANEHNMTSNVTVKYDGERFYWRIKVASRTDSLTLPAELAGNDMVERFDVSRNAERIFAWDGARYTIHSASVNHSIVDVANRFPRAVNGPLTAGVVPWGQGTLTYSNLSAAGRSGAEISRDGTTQIEITIEPKDGSSMTFALDPARDYAVTSCTLTELNGKTTSRYCSGYRQVAGNWVPLTVLIEQHDTLSGRLLRSDKWDLTTVSAAIPPAEQFNVEYAADALVEYYSPVSARSSIYQYSNAADMDLLLAEHLAYTATSGKQRRNCATAAVGYAAAQLGKSVSSSALAQLVDSDGQTTMYDLKQFTQGLGVYCRAVKTDMATLKDLPACQVILHIPGKNHFVVLDRVDEQYAWIVDLSKSAFYYRKDIAFVPMDWSEGTALLLSAQPITGPLANIDDGVLKTLAGGDGWDCTLKLQDEYVMLCTQVGGDCWGMIKWYYERWGCDDAPSGGCIDWPLARYIKDECVWDPWIICSNEGHWDIGYLSACK